MNTRKIYLILFIILSFFISKCKSNTAIAASNDKELTDKKVSFQIKIGEKASSFFNRLAKQGLSNKNIIKKISKTEKFKSFPIIKLPKNSDKLRIWEGLFKPGHYQFTVKDIDKNASKENQKYDITLKILKHLLKVNQERIDKIIKSTVVEQYKIIRLASIVEKEAVTNNNYKLIASVFTKRLKQNIPLASCPSVEYIIGYHRPFLIAADLKNKSGYNVYYHKGLPPTAIAFVSDEALEAVVHPAKNNYYFFVFDWVKEKHYFAANFSQHLKNSKIARKNYIKKFGYKKAFQIYKNKYYEP